MHYGIVALGSRGDVQPFVALALGLQDHGHQVTLMAHENFKDFTQGFGIDFHPLPGDVEEMLYSPRGRKVLRSGNMLVFMRFVQKEVAKNQPEVNQAILKGAEKVDVLVTSVLGMIWVDTISTRFNKPWATVQLSFPTTPTSEFPFTLLDFFDFPWYNQLSYRIFDFLYSKDYISQLNDFRNSLGLSKIKGPLLRKMTDTKTPNLYAISQALLPRPTDWPSQSQVMGFIYLPAHRREENPAEAVTPQMARWIEAGEKPVYIGFGSIPVPDPAKLIRILKGLLEQTTYRFFFCQGWSHLEDLPEHPRLFVTTAANHSWLFPRCRAAIIHGGVGTTAAALKARLPLVVGSIFADQPWWGKLVERRGLGIHLPFSRWTTPRLSAALRAAEAPAILTRVTEIGDQMTREDGLEHTITALETYFSLQTRNITSPVS